MLIVCGWTFFYLIHRKHTFCDIPSIPAVAFFTFLTSLEVERETRIICRTRTELDSFFLCDKIFRPNLPTALAFDFANIHG